MAANVGSVTDSKADIEEFVPGYADMPDEELREMPERALTEPIMFVCTVEADLDGLKMSVADSIERMTPGGVVLAINSNFNCKAQPGFEKLLKLKRKPPRPKREGRERKMQGNGASFNSALEPIISLDLSKPKIYKVRCFPSTGWTQVPGTLQRDLSDAREVLNAWVAFLNETKISSQPVTVRMMRPNMVNMKFRVNRSCPRILLSLQNIYDYFRVLDDHSVTAKSPILTLRVLEKRLPGASGTQSIMVPPPHRIRELKYTLEEVKISFRIEFEGRLIRVNIFQKGKINILGANSVEAGITIHEYLYKLFSTNWNLFVVLCPRSDAELARVKRINAGKNKPALETVEKIEQKEIIPEPISEKYPVSDDFLEYLLGDSKSFDFWEKSTKGKSSQKELAGEEKKVTPAGITLEVLKMLDEMEADAEEFEPASDDADRDEMIGNDVEEHEKYALEDRAKGSGGAPLDGTTEPGDDAIGEDVAYDE